MDVWFIHFSLKQVGCFALFRRFHRFATQDNVGCAALSGDSVVNEDNQIFGIPGLAAATPEICINDFTALVAKYNI